MLTPEQRVRYARHRSLVEVGDEGQRALLAAPVGAPLADPRAERVREDYLLRAGLAPNEGSLDGSSPFDATFVAAFAGAPDLQEAAASCLGSLLAVERIKQVIGVGRPLALASLPPELELVESD